MANFRLKSNFSLILELQEHNETIFKISDENRIEYNLRKKYMLNLKI